MQAEHMRNFKSGFKSTNLNKDYQGLSYDPSESIECTCLKLPVSFPHKSNHSVVHIVPNKPLWVVGRCSLCFKDRASHHCSSDCPSWWRGANPCKVSKLFSRIHHEAGMRILIRFFFATQEEEDLHHIGQSSRDKASLFKQFSRFCRRSFWKCTRPCKRTWCLEPEICIFSE